jgi:eukaryotic-like serine/threonine-protein kinase
MDVRRIAMRAAATVAVTAAAGLLLAACATRGSGAQSPTDRTGERSAGLTASAATLVRTFRPYDSDGHLTVAVGHRTSGHCWEGSLAAPAATTYRCLAGNAILDPCFASAAAAHPAKVACFTDPWSKATLLTLTHRLPSQHQPPARPWAAVLADGARCIAATGTAPFVHGVGLGYACSDGTWAALRGVGSSHVHALVGREGGHTLHRTSVTTLWHA